MSIMSRFAMPVVFIVSACAGAAEPEPVMGAFEKTPQGLRYHGGSWSVQSDGARGWTSLKAGEAEFLQSDAARGAFAFQKGDAWFTAFPDRDILSHDDWVGRCGHVADGVNMLKISPDW